MKIQTFGLLLLSVLMIMFLFNHHAMAQNSDSESEESWNTEGQDAVKPDAEPDGTEGFGVAIGSGSTEVASASSTADANGVKMEGVIEVDTYLNIRTGPWGKIIGGLNNLAKIQIISKDGDWFRILYDGKEAFVHAYYVSAPGFPSHQGIEPPSGVGSDADPYASAVTGDPGSSATVDNGTFGAEPCSPMPDSVSSNFGPRDISVGSSYHEGIDLPVPNGTRLNALGNGVVTEVGWTDGGGKFVKVRYDNGYSSFYCHLESVSVEEGQQVAIGQDIARSDNTGEWTTGAHLHMGVMDSSGEFVNPRDVPGLEFPPLVE